VDFGVGGGRFTGCGSQQSHRRQCRFRYVEGRGYVNIFIARVIILLIIVINQNLILHPNSVFQCSSCSDFGYRRRRRQ